MPIIDPTITRDFVVAVNARRPLSAAVKAVRELIVEKLAEIQLQPPGEAGGTAESSKEVCHSKNRQAKPCAKKEGKSVVKSVYAPNEYYLYPQQLFLARSLPATHESRNVTSCEWPAISEDAGRLSRPNGVNVAAGHDADSRKVESNREDYTRRGCSARYPIQKADANGWPQVQILGNSPCSA